MKLAFGTGGVPGTWWMEPWLDGMVIVAACPAGHRADLCRRSPDFPTGHPDDAAVIGKDGVVTHRVPCGHLGCDGVPEGSVLVGYASLVR